jgi:hypothetical protein
MQTAQDLITLIEPRMAELRAVLTPAQRKSFEDRYYALTDALTAGEDSNKVAQDLLALVRKYPRAAKLLQLDEPIPPKETAALDGFADGEGVPPPLAAPAVTQPAIVKPQPGVKPMTETPPTPVPAPVQERKGISVEAFTTIFKEAVTAIIALLLVWTTIRVITSLLGFVGDELRMNQAKDLLSVLTGLMGVVLGYYFGRIPAEAHAAQAQEQANQAVAQGEQAKARSEMIGERAGELADQASDLVAGMQNAPMTRGQATSNEVLKQWVEEVNDLRRMARSR